MLHLLVDSALVIIVCDNGKNRLYLPKDDIFFENQLQIRRKDRTFDAISFIINLSSYR